MQEYDPRRIESKWQAVWDASCATFRTRQPEAGAETFYCLEMLPYPSGNLHMGHVRNYSIGDAVARFERMRGRVVMHVIGWDAFGMPAENAAIQHGENPAVWTRRNIDNMRAQLERLGTSYDWEREISTCDPSTTAGTSGSSWRCFDAGQAYRARRRLNWCEQCETVWPTSRWSTDAAGAARVRFDCASSSSGSCASRTMPGTAGRVGPLARLAGEGAHDAAQLDRPQLRGQGRLRRSKGSTPRIEVFTTRIDTIYGATYVALAAEHPLVEELASGGTQETRRPGVRRGAALAQSRGPLFRGCGEARGVHGPLCVEPVLGRAPADLGGQLRFDGRGQRGDHERARARST